MSDGDSQFARGAQADLFGKLDAEVTLRIPDTVLEDLNREAHELGMDLSKFLRTVLYVRLYGLEHVQSLQQQQLQRNATNAPRLPHGGRS